MGKNVAVFVDVANIFYAAKSAGVDIDYVTLLKAAIAGRDFVRAYAYTGLDPDNENQRNFHSFLSRHGYKVVSKDIRKYGDGKVKANLDIELVVDMLKTARNLDVAIVVSGDGDFAPAIRAVQEMGVRVEVISFRGNTSSDLIDVADIFTDITQLAKVERGSSRSGRRVAADDEYDMSMTEVPDKQTEGSGTRGRRGRGRAHAPEAEPVAAAAPPARRRTRTAAASPVSLPSPATPITVLPGERLSRVAAPQAVTDLAAEEDEGVEATDVVPREASEFTVDGEPRRRRRRGGRGRGRGRGRADEGTVEQPVDRPLRDVAREAPREPAREVGRDIGRDARDARDTREAARDARESARDIPEDAPAARGPRPTPFGSVWDSQLGVPTAPAAGLGPLSDAEDEEEPEIPEYLLAERRRGQAPMGRGRGPAPVGRPRSGYAAAVDRERYGRGGVSRYSEPPRQPQPSRPPQRRDDRPSQPVRSERPARPERPHRPEEPWSEVPPEIEEMLRAQMAARGGRPAERQPDRGGSQASERPEGGGRETPSPESIAEEPPAAARRGRRPRVVEKPGAEVGAAAIADAASTPEPARRGARRRAGSASEAEAIVTDVGAREAGADSDFAAGTAANGEPAPAEAAFIVRRRRTSASLEQGRATATGAGSRSAASGTRSRARTTTSTDPAEPSAGSTGAAEDSAVATPTGVRRGRPPRAAGLVTDNGAGAAKPRARRAPGGAAARKAADAAAPGQDSESGGAAGLDSESGEAPGSEPRRRATRGASEPA